MLESETISAIILAGGKGSRMQATLPKQYWPLQGKPVVLHSVSVFLAHPLIQEVVVVCETEFQPLFAGYPLSFAQPGLRRQDSMFNGYQALVQPSNWICIHDAARPFISLELLDRLFASRVVTSAATVGMPVKWTVKEASTEGTVQKTLNRERIWEIQTPQLLARSILEEGYLWTQKTGTTVTDDVSLAEYLGYPVSLIKGHYHNLKITTPEDWDVAQCISTKPL